MCNKMLRVQCSMLRPMYTHLSVIHYSTTHPGALDLKAAML